LKKKITTCRKQKNPRRKSGKHSPYTFLNVLECYAMDMSVTQAAARTRVSSRSMRDTYDLLRQKMVKWAILNPAMFNGFGTLLFNTRGEFEPEVLALILQYSNSSDFKKRLRRLYPRYDVNKQPVFLHAIEFFIRKFTAMEPPKITPTFHQHIQKSLRHAELVTLHLLLEKENPRRTKRYYWALLQGFTHRNSALRARFYEKHQKHNRIFYDLKQILLKDPL